MILSHIPLTKTKNQTKPKKKKNHTEKKPSIQQGPLLNQNLEPFT